ncbi:hypothetical protein [Haloarchaeobius sp. DFWS5]|uniref:hypothetical protein n=1 Tax=Haloarchaeobius sp. DFWS5 TaxID=3446114 RepID=UPI003EB6C07C
MMWNSLKPTGISRRRYLQTGVGVLALSVTVVPALAQPRTRTVRPHCVEYASWEDGDEEGHFCTGPAGGYYDVEEDDGDEEEYRFDGNGVLRYYRREEDDGDERTYGYDENGVLRYLYKEDDDGDERVFYYDAGGRLVESFYDDD